MKALSLIQAVCAGTAVALLVGCASGSAISPGLASKKVGSHVRIDHKAGYFTCPAQASLRYVSDVINSVINVYVGRFAGQSPCGQIPSDTPLGMHVELASHDLYVANFRGNNIVVFHRGQLTPYNSYVDPSGQRPSDVTVAPDGTVIAANQDCTLSTWIGGPSGGTFVGTFTKPECRGGGITFIAVQTTGTLYYVASGSGASREKLWSVSCPGGNCSVPIRVPGAHVDFFGSGVAADSAGSVLAVKASANGGNNKLATFDLPNPKPSIMDLATGFPLGIAINEQDHVLFVADNTGATEYIYPSGKVIGTVSGNPGGAMDGIAIDPEFSSRR
jgi:hypothetical protein